MLKLATPLLGLMLLLFTSPFASAAVVVGSPTLLNQTKADQLETWLNEGQIQITKIYEKQTGHTSVDFYNAVDGQGRTFVLIEINAGSVSGAHDNWTAGGYDNIPHQIIGGYNPQSWHSNGGYNYTSADADRTAFLFNLTSNEIQRQNLNAEGYNSWTGAYQTFNGSGIGPIFGGGSDIYVDSSLNFGFTNNYSYGGTSYFNDIIQSPDDGTATNWHYHAEFSIGAIEVFTIANLPDGAVPEAGSFVIWSLLGLTCSAAGWRRRKQSTARRTATQG